MNLKRTAALVATSTLLAGLVGCGSMPASVQPGMKKIGTYNAAAKRKSERGGTWNILVHMSAENNLYRFGLEDMNEMEAGLPADGSVNVYVLFDGIKNGDSAIYKIKRDAQGMNRTLVSEIVDDGGFVIPASKEIDSGDAEVGARFLTWAGKNLKADHTMIGYWDHGSGVFNNAPNPITKGFGHDDRGSHMSTADISKLVGAFKAAAGKPLTIIGFDACLMAHGEIAYQAAGGADYLIASEELEPGKGWDYELWLNRVSKIQSKTPAAVGSALVESFHDSYQPGGSQSSGRDETTLSMTDIRAFTQNVVPALDNFVTASTRSMDANKAAFQAARAKAQTFYNKDCADLGSFLKHVKSTTRDRSVTAAAMDLEKAYAASIVSERHITKFDATGLVLYFPTPTQRYNAVYDDASKIGFARTSWNTFLKAYR